MALSAFSQEVRKDLLQQAWEAQWITGPGEPVNRRTATSDGSLREYGVFKFRKQVDLEEKPASFIVHVSADNRYKLFVNGNPVSHGPARGDLYFWNFETVDLAPYLREGRNTVAAVVWNDGPQKPQAQITYLTAFILQGDTGKEEVLNTNDSWKTIRDESYRPLPVRVTGYYVAGPGELVDMNRHVTDWTQTGLEESNWNAARVLGAGVPKEAAVNHSGWMLVPSPLPQMEMTVQRLEAVRRSANIQIPDNFPAVKTSFTIPANTNVTILLDQGFLTNAYPTLEFSGGRHAGISLSYAEGLYDAQGVDLSGSWIPEMPKGNRNEIEGKTLVGKKDSVISNGNSGQMYTPLWWRTYRYLQLRIQTRDEPLVIEDIYGTFTGYPFVNQSSFMNASPEMEKMLDIGWRTARLCAFETYMDCPYYEQLQYIGDTRIQALVSLYNTGDDRLVRYGLELMDHSRIAEGITLSRYPTDLHQRIPTFSLWWIGMIHDYYWYGPDTEFVKSLLPGTRQVLTFFHRYQSEDGSLKDVPYWIFSDWVNDREEWNFGMAPVGEKGESAILDMQLLWTYQLAADLEQDLGLRELAEIYRNRAGQLREAIRKKYWDPEKGLFADTEEKNSFCQHVNSLAILNGMVTGNEAVKVADQLLKDKSLAPASIYFKYYLHQALVKAGMGDDYLDWLDIWRENMELGLTTWAEDSPVTSARSDCHAWGSSPNIEFYRTILGIDSDAPGFSRVKIEPHLGDLERIGGEMPHPKGQIKVAYEIRADGLEAEISLPPNTGGIFIWKGETHELKSGENKLSF
jgi:hypothetical protein